MKVQAQPHWRWRVSLDRTQSRGSVQDCLCLHSWGDPGQGRMGVLQNNECWWFGQSPSSLPSSSHPLKADCCSPEIFILMGSVVAVCFWWGTSSKQNSSCLALPCVRSLSWWDRTEVSCSTLNLKWEAECLEVLSLCSCSRTEVEAEAGGSSLLLQWNNHSSQLCNPGVSWEWSDPSRKLRTGCRGREGFREPTLTLHQVVTIKGEILTCTVRVWAQWLPYESS